MDRRDLLHDEYLSGAGISTAVFHGPHCCVWLVIVGSMLALTYLTVASWVEAATLWAGLGNRQLGEFFQRYSVRVVVAVLTSSLWMCNLLQACWALSTCKAVPPLVPVRWKWFWQTLLIGYPSLALLQDEVESWDIKNSLPSGGAHTMGFIESMIRQPDDDGQLHLVEGSWRWHIERFVESPKVQLAVLILLLVDLFVVLLEVIVSVNLVQFVDPEFGRQFEKAMHLTSISILSLLLFELFLMMYAYRSAFFTGKGSFWLTMDLIVVTVALMIETTIVILGEDYDEYSGFVGLLVLIRVPWRIVRMVHAVIVMAEKVHHAAEHALHQAADKERHMLGSEDAMHPPLGVVRPVATAGEKAAGSAIISGAGSYEEICTLREANASLISENRKLQQSLANIADHSVLAVDPLPPTRGGVNQPGSAQSQRTWAHKDS
eukprot:COSAG02_NODE_10633_length_1894_cov_1.470752_1_plen_433_part_00